jgi:23S rRNA (adenine2503-C2)-methyltransferase
MDPSGFEIVSLPPPARLPALVGWTLEQLSDWLKENGQPAYRAKQIRQWILKKRAKAFSDMLDLPKALREQLQASFTIFPGTVIRHQVASDRTEKLLVELQDQQQIECVLMRETERNTVCISTQVGCGMGCVFCASGMLGLKRNLTMAEIIQQILLVDRLQGPDERITNIVVMGIGEPLANLGNLLPALQILQSEESLGLSPRRITISTVGLPEKIRELANLGMPYNLAVSLHAPNETLRSEIVPVNKKIGIQNVMQAADDYFQITGRRVTFEYVMLRGVNDGQHHAKELGILLKNRHAHVNLIPMNSVEPLTFAEPQKKTIHDFVTTLENYGVTATVRKRKGEDIDAACGQLRLKATTEKETATAI